MSVRSFTHKQASSAAEIQNRITDLKMLQKEYNEVAGEEFSLDEALKFANQCMPRYVGERNRSKRPR